MKLKSLLYGTAAVLVSTGATNVALAADLPVAAEPVEYVRICDAFGNGFYYIPGTDTCLRVNGRVRVRAFVRDKDDDNFGPDPFNPIFSGKKNQDAYTSYARAYINMDARTQTDLGLLRSYFTYRLTYGDRGIDTSDYDLGYGTAMVLDEAFISLSNDMGQLTVGQTASFFDFFGGYTLTGNGGFDQTSDAILFAYTFNVGNGVSATVSLEDAYGGHSKHAEGDNNNTVYGNGAPFNVFDAGLSPGNNYAAGTIYGGQDMPDIVANLRVDQGWGSAQIMGALRQINVKEGAFFGVGGLQSVSFIDDEWGWALGAGLEVDIPGAPVSLATQGGYSEGACDYVAAAPGYLDDALAHGNGVPGVGKLDLTECWQIGAGINIAASSTVSVQIDGAYGDIDHYGSLFDYDYWGVAGVVAWQPVSGLTVAAEIQYSELDADVSGALCPGAAFAECPMEDDDSWQFTLSFQRDF